MVSFTEYIQKLPKWICILRSLHISVCTVLALKGHWQSYKVSKLRITHLCKVESKVITNPPTSVSVCVLAKIIKDQRFKNIDKDLAMGVLLGVGLD